MSIGGEKDLEGMKRAGQVVRLALARMKAAVKPGVTTAELDRIAGAVLREHGARSAPRMVYGFPGDVLISVNDEAVHGIPGPRALKAGDVVKLDVTVEKDGYMADAALTVGVAPFPDRTRALIACAKAAFERALEVARVGNRVNDIGRAVEDEVTKRGFVVLRDLNGHGIGRTIHEAPTIPNYFDPRYRQPLTEGLVITIEPIIAERSAEHVEDDDGWTLRTRGGDLAAHWEHTMVITRDRPLLLTAA